jgi:xylose isomerase
MYKLAGITSFFGSVKNRYMSYHEDKTLDEKIRMASKVQGLDGLELCYPGDFDNIPLLKELLTTYGMGVSAINFRSRRTGKWMRGSFSSGRESERREVTDDLKRAIDLSREFGCNRVTTCPLNDGHDYIFEMDYFAAYDFFEDTIGEAAGYDPDVKLCIEYKWNDPRARCLLGNAGETLAFCQKLQLPNVGVTLDFGHSIQAGERPAQSLAMLARENRLFYVHLNDNDKYWDWDMIPGAYNFWDFIEFFYYLKKAGYNDWISFDVFSKEFDIAETYTTSVEITRRLVEIADRLDDRKIAELLSGRNCVENLAYLYSLLHE